MVFMSSPSSGPMHRRRGSRAPRARRRRRRARPCASARARSAPPCRPRCSAGSRGPAARSKLERRVDLEEVVVRADLDRPIAGVRHGDGRVARPTLMLDVAGSRGSIAPMPVGARLGIGWCTVTSLVPSGKVASTCTSGISSATPSITSSRRAACVPVVISSATCGRRARPRGSPPRCSATASG